MKLITKEFAKEKYSQIDYKEMQVLIKEIKDIFQAQLTMELDLLRVSAPLFVEAATGLNDDLSGSERKVEFTVKESEGTTLSIVQSLAKWKRVALHKYGFKTGEGLYTDMNAIRRDDVMDETHSFYVDQWDWEKIITREQRTPEYLKSVVEKIVKSIAITSRHIQSITKAKLPVISDKVFWIDSQTLLDMYPTKTPEEREYEIAKLHKTVFITKIGPKLTDGVAHSMRSPDYDDWKLNGDIIFYHEVLDCASELSSMGIRVDGESLKQQLKATDKEYKLEKFEYHQNIRDDVLPLTIGGGIGQSRMCQLILGRAHIGEVQAGYWKPEHIKICEAHGIKLL